MTSLTIGEALAGLTALNEDNSMKLYCLSGNPNRPCFVLTFKKTTIMLDCGLDVSSLLHFLPLPLTQGGKFTKAQGWSPGNVPGGVKLDDELKEVGGKIFVDSEPEFFIPELKLVDMSEVDIILLSSHHCMLALPYITQYTNFRGVVYATEPTLTLGKLYMEEMIEYISSIPKHNRATKWKLQHILNFLPVPLRDAVNPIAWRQVYSRHDVNACMSKVHMIGYNEKLDVFGNVEVTAISSGFSLGSCNWVIQSQYEKIAYISGSSTLTTHPKPMEQAPLRNSDILVMCSLSQTPLANPDAMIGEFCVNTAMTLRNGGNVLVPCFSSGVTYDLFECLSGHLDSCGLAQIPLYFISPIAQSSLAYSNIYAEWLSSGKQAKVYLPEAPFPHAELVKGNRLKPFRSLHEGFTNEMKTPCVVFTGHPSMRFGNIVHFLELWGKSSGNTLIITEPDFPYLDALAPYQPLSMKICYCPIDTSLNFAQANKLIRDLKPVHLVVAEQLTTPPLHHPHNTDLVIDVDPPPVTYRRADVLSLPIKRRYEKMEMEPELASSLIPVEVKPGVAVATVNSQLLSRDYKYVLKPLEKKPEEQENKVEASGSESFPKKYVWGNLDVQEFALQLTKQGIQDVKVEENPGGGHIVHLQSEDTLIQIDEGSTHIICEGNEQLRVKLRDTLLKCLAKF